GVVGVQTNKAIDVGQCPDGIVLLVVGINQVKLHLVGVGAERVAGVHGFQQLGGANVVSGLQSCLGILIQHLRSFIRNFVLVGAGAAGGGQRQGQCQGEPEA